MEASRQITQKNRPTWQLFLPAAILTVSIFILSHQERPPTIGDDPQLSAIAGHLIAYGMLGGALWLAFSSLLRHAPQAALAAILGAGLYGVVEEIHQSFVPGRHADPWDLLADVVGATIVVLLIAGWRVSTRSGLGIRRNIDRTLS